MNPEVLLEENPQRYSVFPIQFQNLWDLTKQSSNFFWLADVRHFSEDLKQWKVKLDNNKQLAIELVFASFLHCDLEINLKFVQEICEKIEATEAKIFFGNYIHKNLNQKEAYRIFLLCTKNNANELHKLKDDLKKISVFDKKTQWAQKWYTDTNVTFGEQIIAMMAMVAIFFSQCYAIIMSLAKFDLMVGLQKIHENILKDRQFLLEFCFRLYDYVCNKPSESRIADILDEAIDLEFEFMCSVFLDQKVLFCSHEELGRAFANLKKAVLNCFNSTEVFDLRNCILDGKIELSVPSKSKIFSKIPKTPERLHVIKRNGQKEYVYFDKITSRIKKLCYGLNMDFIDPGLITFNVIRDLKNGITTVELDNLAAEYAAKLINDFPEYEILAARIAISNLHKETKKSFSDVIDQMYREQKSMGISTINADYYAIIIENADKLNSCIIYDRDFYLTYENFKILEQKYLFRIGDQVIERPQQLFLRTAVNIHGNDIESVIKTYNLISEKFIMFSDSILRSACMFNRSTVSSCTLAMRDDSIEGIYESVEQANVLVDDDINYGFNMQCIRAKGSVIRGTNGTSNGIVPMLRVFSEAIVQPNFCTVYLEPWHSDLFDFLEMKELSGVEEFRATNLNYALWIPDLFMRRVQHDQLWSFMCPNECRNLITTWGEEFEKVYLDYEEKGKYRYQKPAKDIWKLILDTQLDTGNPSIHFKDTCNRKSNQQNLGTIQGANLAGDVVQYSSADMIGVVLQASVLLTGFVKNDKFNFEELRSTVKHLTTCLDLLIDKSYYSLQEAENYALKSRSIGIGVQGLADVFILLRCDFESEQAAELNRKIFETIYFGALEASCELAKRFGPYELYANSPISKNQLQFDFCEPNSVNNLIWNWNDLRKKIGKFGVRNSLLVSIMSGNEIYQIFGHSPSVQPLNSTLCQRVFKKEKFNVINRNLIQNLSELGLWNAQIKDEILQNHGSVQNIANIPDILKGVYKTVWEIPLEKQLQMYLDRSKFIDQGQSVHLFVTNPSELSAYYFKAWHMGLKSAVSRLTFRTQKF